MVEATTDMKKDVEAILFASGRTVTQEEIERILDIKTPGLVKEIINELKQVRNHLLDQDLETYFDRAATTRLAIPKDSKGFLRPLYDVSIAVEDIPGVIAKFSNLLAKNTINIKDIEVLKVREGEGGSIRLAFETERERQEAVKLIRDAGFSCYARD